MKIYSPGFICFVANKNALFLLTRLIVAFLFKFDIYGNYFFESS